MKEIFQRGQLAPAGLLAQDVVISWFDGALPKRENLKGKIERIELLTEAACPLIFPVTALLRLRVASSGVQLQDMMDFLQVSFNSR